MECQGDSHNWFLGSIDQTKATSPFMRATWLCSCGGYKVVDHEFDVNELKHPDFRDSQMKLRAEQDEKIAEGV